MEFTIELAGTDAMWQQGLVVLNSVYVGEKHSPPERAAQWCKREALEPGGTFLLAVRDDGVALGAIVLPHAQSALNHLSRQGERELRLLAVLNEARGFGIGQALVLACIERCKADEADALVLWTRPVMTDAQRLYERLGFVRVPERDEPDPGGFTRMVYRLALR